MSDAITISLDDALYTFRHPEGKSDEAKKLLDPLVKRETQFLLLPNDRDHFGDYNWKVERIN